MTPDCELLRRYAEDRSEEAFAELVGRHLELVYSAALRQATGDTCLAHDIAQSVFIDLTRNAAALCSRKDLAGWLYTSAHFAAAKAMRTESRRRAREREARTMHDLQQTTASEAVWEKLEPFLDQVMHELNETDREAILLRYFQSSQHAVIGERLGINENAARMRVERALDKLRKLLARRGITTTASALSLVISANATQAAPAVLAVTISGTAALVGTTLQTTSITAATHAIAMTTLQKTMIAVAMIAALGTATYEARQGSALRTEVRMLRQQQSSLAGQIRELNGERDAAINQLATMREDNERLNRNPGELVKLRGEVDRLRNGYSSPPAAVAVGSDPTESAAAALIAKVNQLKQRFEQNPELKIPELQFLTGQNWLQTAGRVGTLERKVDLDNALAEARKDAKWEFAGRLGAALDNYIAANNGQLPNDVSELGSWCSPPTDTAILQRYELLHTGRLSDLTRDDPVISEKSPVDDQCDTLFKIGAFGFSYQGTRNPGWSGAGGYSTDVIAKVTPFAK